MPTDQRPRFLSEADCQELAQRLSSVTSGGGYTVVQLASTWTGTMRWARNQISTAGEVRDNQIYVNRNLNGADVRVEVNDTTTPVLLAATRQAERLAILKRGFPNSDLIPRLPIEPEERPRLFSDATYQMDAERRTAAAIALAKTAADAGMLSAGDIKVMARSLATMDATGRTLYFQYTHALYRVTVRDPQGTGSGWAGIDHYDWNKIDGTTLTATALDKCVRSRNPVRVEPGRYTTILEPQAVGDLVGHLFTSDNKPMDLTANIYPSNMGPGPFNKERPSNRSPGYTRIGERVIDERITITADPMDPELGFPPFNLYPRSPSDKYTVPMFHKAVWFEKGVLTHLAYERENAIAKDSNVGMPNSGAFQIHVTGPTATIDEMIATTKRGILVTRFDQITSLDYTSQLYRGYTRDGLWLIENGKISKSIKNLAFTESVLFALNNVEQLGAPQRVYSGAGGLIDPFDVPQPRLAPALKIRDFSFTSLTDAV
jgi:predicted Zn-dependent protease